MTTTVYVELDALLDTRLAVVHQISADAAVELVKNDAYYKRTRDDFSGLTGISHEEYRKAWEARDVSALRNAILTHMPLMLKELITKLEIDAAETPFADQLALEVNVWPYQLTPEETDMMQLAVMNFAGIETVPTISCYPPEQLTPEKVKKSYSGLIIYNFRDWLQHHMEQFQKWPCPRITCLAPALFHGEEVDVKKLIQDDMRTDLSAFEMTEMACAEFLGVNLLDVRYFSIFRTQYLPQKPGQPA